MELSIEQQLAAYTDDNKVLVAAAGGAGKTATLVERVNYLLSKDTYVPGTLFCITYTNMAAEEMKIRLGEKVENCFIGTIHGLANKILTGNGYDTTSIIENENFDCFFEIINDNLDTFIMPEVEYLLVDEFQDICNNEYDFIMNILHPKNFWAVGDSRQAIYGFKGGNYEHFMNLINDPFTTTYNLSTCYRCGPEVIDFANHQIRGCTDIYKTPVVCPHNYGYSLVEEDDFSYAAVLSAIEDMGNYAETAVLCRSNQMVDDILFFLKRNNIPAVTFKKADKTFNELQEELKSNSVKVLTVHSAKGLEWRNVIVCQEVQPWNAEEKRINYVAATRAKQYLLWLKPIRKRKTQRNVGYKQQYMESQMQEW